MLTPEEKALLQRHITIDGDGNVVGNDNTVHVTKVKTDTYTVQKDQRQVTVTVQDLRQIQQSQVAGVGDNWHVEGGIHYNVNQTASDAPRHPRVYHNLPQPDYGEFVGRKAELAQVHRILRPYPHSRHAVVTIDGIGGIGKSALALEVAHRYLRDYDRLPAEERFDAIVWTSAKASVLTGDGIAPRQQITRTLEDIYTAIAVTLEREAITRTRPEEQDALVTKALTRQRTLLIVDNLETMDDERVNAFLRELPAPTKAIVTTRHRIDVAYPIRLTGMPETDALGFILQECSKKGVALTDEEAQKLYRRTGGVPLAMSWSIAQIGYGYNTDTVLRRLGQPTGDIARFCFSGSLEIIENQPSYRLLMALSCFFVDASRESLGDVTELPELARDEGLAQLMKLSLVNKKADRFTLLPLTKQYAAALLLDQPRLRKALEQRWIEWLVDFSRQHGGESWDWRGYRALDSEIENILALVELGLEKEWTEVLTALRLIIFYLAIRGRWADMIQLGRDALPLAQKEEDLISIGALGSQCLAWTLGQLKHLEEAEKYARIGLRAHRKAEIPQATAYSLRILGAILRKQQRHREALETYQEALEIAQVQEDRGLIGNLQGEIGKVMRNMGKHPQAWHRFENAVQLLESREADKPVYASILGHMGTMAYEQGNLDVAHRYCKRCLEIFNEINGVTEVQLTLARLYVDKGDVSCAIDLLQQARGSFQRRGMTQETEEATDLLQKLTKGV